MKVNASSIRVTLKNLSTRNTSKRQKKSLSNFHPPPTTLSWVSKPTMILLVNPTTENTDFSCTTKKPTKYHELKPKKVQCMIFHGIGAVRSLWLWVVLCLLLQCYLARKTKSFFSLERRTETASAGGIWAGLFAWQDLGTSVEKWKFGILTLLRKLAFVSQILHQGVNGL